MATVTKKIGGAYRNKIGDFIYAKYRNKLVVRSKPTSVRNPRTLGQISQRNRLSAMSSLAQAMSAAIIAGYKKATMGSKYSPRNLFVKDNFALSTAGGDGTATINYSGVKVSRGPVAKVTAMTPEFDNPNEVAFDVSYDNLVALGVSRSNLNLKVVIYCPELDITFIHTEEGTSNRVEITTPTTWSGQRVYVYTFVVYGGNPMVDLGYDTGDVSESSYVGSGNIS